MDAIKKHRSFLMGFATLWIYCFQQVPVLERWDNFLYHCFQLLIYIGFIGVDLFVILSGFGLVHSFKKHPIATFEDYVSYLKRRF